MLIGATTVLFPVVYAFRCVSLIRSSGRWAERAAALGGLVFRGWAVVMSGRVFQGIAPAFFAATTAGWFFVRRRVDPAIATT